MLRSFPLCFLLGFSFLFGEKLKKSLSRWFRLVLNYILSLSSAGIREWAMIPYFLSGSLYFLFYDPFFWLIFAYNYKEKASLIFFM